MSKFKTFLYAACVPLAFAATHQASAMPVEKWSFTVGSTFDVPATPTGPGPGFVSGATEISWGDPAGTVSPGGRRSSIEIVGAPTDGMVETVQGGPLTAANLGDTQVFRHNNNTLSQTAVILDSAVVSTTATLVALDEFDMEILGSEQVFDLDFLIDFEETVNAGPCVVAGSPPGACGDIFVVDGGGLDIPFDYDGFSYFVSIFPSTGPGLTPLATLLDAECAAAGAAAGCAGFTTQEAQSNDAQFNFIVSTRRIVDVPEPGSIALLGFGLMGLGLAARRRRA